MRFIKKPVVIEAIQLTADNLGEVEEFINCDTRTGEVAICKQGVWSASTGDWIIRGEHGKYYLCKPDIFEQTYDSVKKPGKSVL